MIWNRGDERIAHSRGLVFAERSLKAHIKIACGVDRIKALKTLEIGIYIQSAKVEEDIVAENIGFFADTDGPFEPLSICEGESGQICIGPQAVFPLFPGLPNPIIFFRNGAANPDLVDDFRDLGAASFGDPSLVEVFQPLPSPPLVIRVAFYK